MTAVIQKPIANNYFLTSGDFMKASSIFQNLSPLITLNISIIFRFPTTIVP